MLGYVRDQTPATAETSASRLTLNSASSAQPASFPVDVEAGVSAARTKMKSYDLHYKDLSVAKAYVSDIGGQTKG